ncbi:MAG: OmpA family protein [Thermoanaerobaculales bacterium]
MKRPTTTVFLFLGAAVMIQACASSHHSLSFDPGSIDGGRYIRKIDQFVVVADGSLSMADRSQRQRKLGTSESFLASLNQTIPELGYKGGLRTFGRGLCDSKGKTQSILELGDYTTSSFGDGVNAYECPNGASPLDLALEAVGNDLTNHALPTAVIIVTDGLDMNAREFNAAKALKDAFGDNLDIYAVQIGDSSKGRALLEQVVATAGDGYVMSATDLRTAQAIADFVIDVFLFPDEDGDGVPDHLDRCPYTPQGVAVDEEGCPLDSDGDGVPDYLDKCPGTPKGIAVDARGCPVDSDGDGVPDYLDRCPETPKGAKVDAEGCPLDSDGDGVPDYLDRCPGTPKGVPVDEHGCPPKGIEVVGDEWMVRGKVLFALNSADLRPEANELLAKVADFLKKNPQYLVEIQGNTDNTGPKAWNMLLSEMRAESVKDFLVSQGVDAGRLTTKGFGPNEPIVANDTPENRAKNRRVDFKPSVR